MICCQRPIKNARIAAPTFSGSYSLRLPMASFKSLNTLENPPPQFLAPSQARLQTFVKDSTKSLAILILPNLFTQSTIAFVVSSTQSMIAFPDLRRLCVIALFFVIHSLNAVISLPILAASPNVSS